MEAIEKLRSYITHPVESIACALSGGVVLYGLLIAIGVMFNWFHPATGSSDLVVYTFSALYIFSGMSFLFSYFKGSVNAGGKLLYVFVCYTTMFLVRVSQYVYPITWLAPLVCAIITAILYIWMSTNARN